jgi:hypothetical protein
VQTKTTEIGMKRYFHKFPSLSDDDIKVATMFCEALKDKDETNEDFINISEQILRFYSGRKDFISFAESTKRWHQWFANNIGISDEYEALAVQKEKEISDYIKKGLEDRYCHAEHAGFTGLEFLQAGDTTFWNSQDERSQFCYFFLNQYFRTKNMRDNLASGMKTHVDDMKRRHIVDSKYTPNMEGIAQILCDLMEARYVCSDILFSKKPVLLVNTTSTPFITSDQPIINISETNDKGLVADFTPYYPITPTCALIFEVDRNNENRILTEDDVIRFNSMVFKRAYEQVYANNLCSLKDHWQTSVI